MRSTFALFATAFAAISTVVAPAAGRDRPAPSPSRYGYVLKFDESSLPKGVTIRELKDKLGTRHFIRNDSDVPLVINGRFQNGKLVTGAKLVAGKVYHYFPNGVPVAGKRHLKGWQMPFGKLEETLIRLPKDPNKIYEGRKPGLSKELPKPEPVEFSVEYAGKPSKIKATVHYHLNPAYDKHYKTSATAAPPEFKWKAVEIDKIQIGYGLQMADVNGDGKTDIVLADKNTFQWYQNPTWQKHIIARNLTKRDNVCITARDIDGDGKCEIAVGGQWNYREAIKDGAVFYLVPPADRTQLWSPVRLHNEPSTHRMHWIKGKGGDYRLVVKPLRGRGSFDGDGNGLRLLEYFMPNNPRSAWKYNVICEFMHLSHNFHVVNWDRDPEEELIIAGKEGVWHLDSQGSDWKATQLTKDFAGEIRDGRLPNGRRFIATVEPKHGSKSAVYVEPRKPGGLWEPLAVLTDSLKDGHAVACADYLGVGSDQIVVGWRAMNDPGVPGIKLFAPTDQDGKTWRETTVSKEQVAVEDIKVADLNGDGKVDIVAAARQTKNLVIFFNQTKQPGR